MNDITGDVPASGQPTKSIDAGTGIRRALRCRVSWLREALLAAWPCPTFARVAAVEPAGMSSSPSEKAKEDAALACLDSADMPALVDALQVYERLHEEEEDRKKGAETRLAAILGGLSVLLTIAFGFVSVAFDKGFLARLGRLRGVAIAVFVYAVIQLVAALVQAIRGLAGRYYDEMSPGCLLRAPEQDELAHLRSVIRDHSKNLRNHDQNNALKMDLLGAAHRGLYNFLGAVLLMIVSLTVAGWLAAAPDTSARPPVPSVQVGPPGPPGPPGPKGDTCYTFPWLPNAP